MPTYVLVTGGAGYIGSHTCKALHRAGYVPVTYDDFSTGHRHAVRWGPVIEGDIADTRRLCDVFRRFPIAGVIHLAGRSVVADSITDPAEYFGINVGGTLALLEAMRRAGVHRIVFSSTCAVYGEPLCLPIPETHPRRPASPYAESKRTVEQVLHWYGLSYGLQRAVLRYANAAGADPEGELGEQHVPETHLIPLLIEAVMGKRGPVTVFGTDHPTRDGTAIRDYVHVQDLARAHLLALERLMSGCDELVVNLGTGEGHTVREVIRTVEQVTGRALIQIEAGRRDGDPSILVADPTRARQILSWAPALSDLETIVRSAWDFACTAAGRQHPQPARGLAQPNLISVA